MPDIIIEDGLPAFFSFMNGRAQGQWYLVGGCAAWMHIARAKREFADGIESHNLIFPADIEIVISRAARELLLAELKEGHLKVRVGNRGLLVVDLLEGDVLSNIGACLNISGGNVLPMDDIIKMYGKSGNPDKIKKREERVAMLRCVIAGLPISQANIAKQKETAKPSLFAEMFAKKLRKTGQ